MTARERMQALLGSEAESVTEFAAIITDGSTTARDDIEELLDIAEAAEEPRVRPRPLPVTLMEGITHLATLGAQHEADAEALRSILFAVLRLIERAENDLLDERSRALESSVNRGEAVLPESEVERLRLYRLNRRAELPAQIRDLIESRRRVHVSSEDIS